MYAISFLYLFLMYSTGINNDQPVQACMDFLKNVNCKPEHSEGFKKTGLSRTYNLEIGKSVRYEVVLFGGEEFIIQCCTEDDFYPVRFKLIRPESGKVIYDNKYNDYIDNLNLQLDYTELLAVEISVEPKKFKIRKSKDGRACIGMAIYMREIYK